jgi:hypothetical protein
MSEKLKYFIEAWEMNGVGQTVATVQDSPGTVVTITVDDLRALLARQPAAIDKDTRAAVEFYEANPSAALMDFQKRFAAAPSVEQDERGAFEAWAGNPPVEFEDRHKDRDSFWCWQAWQAAWRAARAASTSANVQDERGALPLSDFREGQWWISELDAWAETGSADQKRAVAVVHRLLRAVRAASTSANVALGAQTGKGESDA